MKESSRIIKNTGYLYIKTLVSMFVMLYVTRTVLRTLGAEDFGIYDVVGGAIAMLGFVNTSMASTVQRFLNNAQGKQDFERQKRIFNVGVAFHLVIALGLTLLLVFLSLFLFNGILNISPVRIAAAKIVYVCLMVNTFFTIITVPYDASINAHEDMLTYAIIGVIDILLKLAIAIAIIYITYDKLIFYAILMMAVPILTFVMMKVYCRWKYKECKINIKRHYNREIAYEMLSFAGWNFMGTTSQVVGNYGNSIVLNHFYGATLNAVAGIANQMQGMLAVLSVGMMRALNPIIYKVGGTDDINKMMDYSYKGCKYSYLLLAVLALPIIIETPYVLGLWLGDIPEWTILFVRLQLLRALLEQLTMTLNKSLEAIGKIKEYNIIVFFLNLTPIVLLFVAYSLGCPPYWHFIVAIIIMVGLVSVVKLYYCKVYCNLSIGDFIKIVLLPCIYISLGCTLVAYAPTCLNMVEGFIRFFISFNLSAIVMVILLFYTLSENEKKEFADALHFVKMKIRKSCF